MHELLYKFIDAQDGKELVKCPGYNLCENKYTCKHASVHNLKCGYYASCDCYANLSCVFYPYTNDRSYYSLRSVAMHCIPVLLFDIISDYTKHPNFLQNENAFNDPYVNTFDLLINYICREIEQLKGGKRAKYEKMLKRIAHMFGI